jgi:hypothetical protein
MATCIALYMALVLEVVDDFVEGSHLTREEESILR